MRKALRLFTTALAIAIALVFVAFALLQTQAGKALTAATIARLASRPNSDWAVDGLGGSVPFALTARRITISDPNGIWLTAKNVQLDIDPVSLLFGELHVRLLRAAEIYKVRPSAGPSLSLVELLHITHLPLALTVDHLAIDRLVLGPPILGREVVATVAGDAALRGGIARADLDIHRIDSEPGQIALQSTLAGVEPQLKLQLRASDPTGIVSDRIFDRTDHLPLALSIDGDGPVSDWRGRLVASAGTHARLNADFALVVSKETALTLSARAAAASLLPANFAPLVGENARLSLHARFGERLVLDRLSFTTAIGKLTGDGAWDRSDNAVAAHLRADLPDLSMLDAITGGKLRGSARVVSELTGSHSHTAVRADLTATGVDAFGATARSLSANVELTPTGALASQQTRVAVEAKGQLVGLSAPSTGALAARIGDEIAWSLAANVDHDARAADLTRFDVHGGGIDLKGFGHLAAAVGGVTGAINLAGSATGLSTGIAAANVLLGPTPSLNAILSRDQTGFLAVNDLTLTGAAAKLTGNMRFDPVSRKVTAALACEIPRLEPLRPALGADVSGSLAATATAEGPLERIQLRSAFDGRGVAIGGVTIDSLQLSGTIADLSDPNATIAGSFRAGRLDGQLGLAAKPIGSTGLAIDNLRLTAAESSLTGNLRIGFDGGDVQGSLSGRFPNLSRWSALAGEPLGGSLELTAGMTAARGGQGLDLDTKGARLTIGTGASSIAIGRLAATARLADLWRQPVGNGRLSLADVRSGPLNFSNATATIASRSPGLFAFQAIAAGHPLSLTTAGEAGLVAGGADLRIARLTGSLDKQNFALEQALAVTRRGPDLTLTPVALRFGSGRVTAGGSLRRDALAFTLNASDLPIAAAARLIGHPNVHGALSVAASLGGSLRAPQARFIVNAAGLALAVARHTQSPRIGLAVEGGWNGSAVNIRGQVTGLRGDRMALTGSVPLLLRRQPFAISIPSQGRLAIELHGAGDIGHLADLLPLDEDRLSGQFAVDASVGGTIAVPSASGRMRLSGARYENFASGAVLTNLDAELVGSGDRFRLTSLLAGDGAKGSLKAQGSLALDGSDGPRMQLSATLANFRIAASDEALATASGTVTVTGPVAAPKVVAPLTIDRAEINLPSSLPPSVVVLKVTEVNGQRAAPLPHTATPPSVPAALDITLGLKGPVLVQGQGLDSQWSGRLKISGTAVAPKIAGTLTANRGSYTLLGKSFRLTRGTITFDGSAKLDPALDIVAEASASDITAQVVITGYASAPTINLSSTPLLPRDEILARVLFGSGLNKITAGQGLELAQAAAALSGKDPGVLDRLRGGLGLDWLRLGQGPAAAASSILNPSVVTPTTQSTTAVSAGKYIAPGVSIGVTQGVSPPTSKVTVEVDLGHHVTVDTEAGQNNGTGIGLNYNYDY